MVVILSPFQKLANLRKLLFIKNNYYQTTKNQRIHHDFTEIIFLEQYNPVVLDRHLRNEENTI